jgi:hypothetical protein
MIPRDALGNRFDGQGQDSAQVDKTAAKIRLIGRRLERTGSKYPYDEERVDRLQERRAELTGRPRPKRRTSSRQRTPSQLELAASQAGAD